MDQKEANNINEYDKDNDNDNDDDDDDDDDYHIDQGEKKGN